jgi:hypothetical protein
MEIDGNIDEWRKSMLRPEDFEQSISNAIELIVDVIHREISQVVQQRFGERIPSSGRNVHLLATVKLERFPTRICELLLKSDTREDSAEIHSRVLTAQFDAEFQLRKQDRRHSMTDLFRLNCLDNRSINAA